MLQRSYHAYARMVTVAVVKNRVTVGHVLPIVSCLFVVLTTDARCFSVDLTQGGLEFSCILTFAGTGKHIKK